MCQRSTLCCTLIRRLGYCILFRCYNIHVLYGTVVEYDIYIYICIIELSKVVAADTLLGNGVGD